MRSYKNITPKGSLFPAILLGIVFIASLTTIELLPADQGHVVAVFAPGTTKPQMVRAAYEARAQIVDQRGFLLFVYSDHKGLPDSLRAAGAYLVVDPVGLAGCGPLVLPGEKAFGRNAITKTVKIQMRPEGRQA